MPSKVVNYFGLSKKIATFFLAIFGIITPHSLCDSSPVKRVEIRDKRVERQVNAAYSHFLMQKYIFS
mgnify:CR=1 FL=1